MITIKYREDRNSDHSRRSVQQGTWHPEISPRVHVANQSIIPILSKELQMPVFRCLLTTNKVSPLWSPKVPVSPLNALYHSLLLCVLGLPTAVGFFSNPRQK